MMFDIVKAIFSFIVVLLLLIITLKYGGNKLEDMQRHKYIKILDKASLSKENSLALVKIGDEAYVMSSSAKGIEILQEVSKEDIKALDEKRKVEQFSSMKEYLAKLNLKGRINNEKEKK